MAIKRRKVGVSTQNDAALQRAEEIRKNKQILEQLDDDEPCFGVPTAVLDLGTHDQGYFVYSEGESVSFLTDPEDVELIEELASRSRKKDKTVPDAISSEEGDKLFILPFKTVTSKKTDKAGNPKRYLFVREDLKLPEAQNEKEEKEQRLQKLLHFIENSTFLEDEDELEEEIELAREIDAENKRQKLPEEIEVVECDSYTMLPYKLIKQPPQQELLLKIELDQEVQTEEGTHNYVIETGKSFFGQFESSIKLPEDGKEISDKSPLLAIATAARQKTVADVKHEDFLDIAKLHTPISVSFSLVSFKTQDDVEGMDMKKLTYTAVPKALNGAAEEFLEECSDFVEIGFDENMTVELLEQANVSREVIGKLKQAIEYGNSRYGGDVVRRVVEEYEEKHFPQEDNESKEEEEAPAVPEEEDSTEKEEAPKTSEKKTRTRAKTTRKKASTSKPSLKVEEVEEEEIDLDDLDDEEE